MQAVIPTYGGLFQIRTGLPKIHNTIELQYDFIEQ